MRSYILLLIVLTETIVGRAQPEFVGLFTSPEIGTIYVVVTAPGTGPKLVKVGDSVGEYIVTSYKEHSETLLLKKDDHVLSLQLRHSKVTAAPIDMERAKQIISMMAGWEKDVEYRVLQGQDGKFYLLASKHFNNETRVSRLEVAAPSNTPSSR